MTGTRTAEAESAGFFGRALRLADPTAVLGALAAVYLAAFLLIPLGLIVVQSAQILLAGGLADLPQFGQRFLVLTRNSLVLAGLVTIIVLAIAIPLSLFLVKAVPYRPLFQALLTIPLLSPPFIGSFAIILLFGRVGVITQLLQAAGLPTFELYGLPGIAIAHVVHTLPLAVLTLAAGLLTVPRSLEESAISLGGSLVQVSRRVVLPYIAPYVWMSALLVFLASFGDVGAPLLVGGNYRVLTVEAYTAFIRFNVDQRIPILLSAWMVVISLFLLYLVRRQMQKADIAPAFTGEVFTYASPAARRIGLVFCALVSFLVLLPYLAILVASFGTVWGVGLLPDAFTLRHYQALARSLEPLRNSLILAGTAAPLAVLLSVAIGKAMRDWGRAGAFLDYVTLLPLVVSGVVIGIGLIHLTGRLRGLGMALPFLSGPGLLVAAYSIRRLPYPMRVMSAAYSRIDRRLEEASYSLGASPARTLWRVTLPQLYPAMAAALVIAFTRIITELGTTLVVYQPGWTTISMQIFSYAQEGLVSRAAAISVLLVAVVAALTGLFGMERRR
ncbi:MAG TPA: iron ABC transporter permease [Limnochordales bacterium]